MTLFSNMQICGSNEIAVQRRNGTVWVTIKHGNHTLTMEDHHAFALANAASDFLEHEAEEAELAAVSGVFTAVDAAERVTA